jgi:hypothetical protein
MKRQEHHRKWAQNRLPIDNGWLAEIDTNIDDQVGDQWLVPHRETIAVQLISTKSICRRRPGADSIASG